MFGSKKRESASFDTALEQVGTIIGPGAVLEGPLTTKDSTRIDGTVKGNVTVSGALIVGQSAKIYGTVSCMNAYIAGEIAGNVSAPQGKVEISDSGKVIGDISCKGIIIDENAVFHGQCTMTNLDKGSAAIAKERAVADKAADQEKAEEKKEESTEPAKDENKSENDESAKDENKSENGESTKDENKSEESKEENKDNNNNSNNNNNYNNHNHKKKR
ncbi:MAG: polymer-forming cytoskeletal protein [Butyrivibrio sp.]|nr:polymer-forming cytoskeletal protein [Butyrivibrio sp.]